MSFLRILESIRMPWLDEVMYWITQFGGEAFFMLFCLTMFWCIDKKRGYYLLSVGFIGTELCQFLKLFFRVPRPWVLDPDFSIVEKARAGANDYSFPSGHSQNIAGLMGAAARSGERKGMRYLYAFLIILVMFSRMYLGVHTPKDVLVGAFIALVLVFMLYPLFLHMEEHPGPIAVLFGMMIAMGAAVLIYIMRIPADQADPVNLESGIKNSYTLLGSVAGMTVTFCVDRKRPFSVQASLPAQICKVGIGMGITVLIRVALKAPLGAVFMGSHCADMVRYCVMVVFAGSIWPLTFPFWTKMGQKWS